MSDVSWDDVRLEFPVAAETVYLDAAAVGPMPNFLRDAAIRAFTERQRPWSDAGVKIRARAQAAFGRFLGVDPGAVVFLANTTDGINAAANALDWQAGDEVVVHDRDFPSNLIPWLRLQGRGVQVRAARSEDGVLTESAIEHELSQRTRLMAVSHVFYQSGFRIDLAALGQRLHRDDILLAVDGIQALGLLQPDLTHVDFYSGAIYKGLCGPFGLGVFYVDPSVADRLTPDRVGYGSLNNPAMPWDGDMPYRAGSQRFQAASVNYPALHAAADMLEYLEAIGFERVTERILELAGRALARLAELEGIRVVTPRDRRSRLGIAAFQVSGLEAEAVAAALAARGVRVAARDGNLRASFHIYNNDDDIDRLVQAVHAVAREERG